MGNTPVGTFKSQYGFSLAELLIALTILAEIATFTIPKVLQGQQTSRFNAIAKESASALAEAYQVFRFKNGAGANTKINDFTPYLNYLAPDTSTSIDDLQGQLNWDCSAGSPCLRLHNGAYIHYAAGEAFGGTTNNNCLPFHIDPDGKYSGSANGQGKAVAMVLYYNGRITSQAKMAVDCPSSYTTYGSNVDPPWFSWDR